MASLSQILADPNYVNANAATKAAIFDKYAPLDPNFANANAATQGAIRSKFGLGAIEQPAVEPESRANVGAELPAFAKENPRLYAGLVKARQMAGPTIEMLGGVGGGVRSVGPPSLCVSADAPGSKHNRRAARRRTRTC